MFYGKELFHLAQPPIWLSVVRDFLIGLFAATFNIGDKFLYQETEDAPFRSDRNVKRPYNQYNIFTCDRHLVIITNALFSPDDKTESCAIV